MDTPHFLILVILCCICIFSTTVAAANITAKVGETWIRWQWSPVLNNLTTNVYIDGVVYIYNSSFNYTYIQGLEPLEEHNIQVYNSSNTTQRLHDSTVRTLYPKWNIFFLIGLEVFMVIILMLSQESFKIILTGGMTISLTLYTSAISYGYEGLYLLPLIIAIVSGLYLAIKLWEITRGTVKWY
jgi:hypothetical protein